MCNSWQQTPWVDDFLWPNMNLIYLEQAQNQTKPIFHTRLNTAKNVEISDMAEYCHDILIFDEMALTEQ